MQHATHAARLRHTGPYCRRRSPAVPHVRGPQAKSSRRSPVSSPASKRCTGCPGLRCQRWPRCCNAQSLTVRRSSTGSGGCSARVCLSLSRELWGRPIHRPRHRRRRRDSSGRGTEARAPPGGGVSGSWLRRKNWIRVVDLDARGRQPGCGQGLLARGLIEEAGAVATLAPPAPSLASAAGTACSK